jgi:hypothetical protein
VPTFALATIGGTVLDAVELDDIDVHEGQTIVHYGIRDLRVVRRLPNDDPERFDVLFVEKA